MEHTVRSLARASPLSATIRAIGLVLLVFSVATCGRAGGAPTTPTPVVQYVEEVFEMARGTPWGPPLERSYDIDVHESGLFSITLEWFNYEYPDDRFHVELREASTGAVLVSHRTCGGLIAPECQAQAAALPITFGAAVRGGQRLVLKVHNSTYLSFRLRVNRPY